MSILNVLDMAVILVCLAGCGQQGTGVPVAPGDTTVPGSTVNPAAPVVPPVDPPVDPPPDPTVVTFIYQNSIGTCAAFTAPWDPTQTTIVFPTSSGGMANGYYTFSYQGVTITASGVTAPLGFGGNTVHIVKTGPANNPPVCTITVTDGKYIGVQ